MAEVYWRKVENLRDALNEDGSRAEAAAILRGLIDEIRLIPKDGELAIYLVGSGRISSGSTPETSRGSAA